MELLQVMKFEMTTIWFLMMGEKPTVLSHMGSLEIQQVLLFALQPVEMERSHQMKNEMMRIQMIMDEVAPVQ
jgi:hypothetical protein